MCSQAGLAGRLRQRGSTAADRRRQQQGCVQPMCAQQSARRRRWMRTYSWQLRYFPSEVACKDIAVYGACVQELACPVVICTVTVDAFGDEGLHVTKCAGM